MFFINTTMIFIILGVLVGYNQTTRSVGLIVAAVAMASFIFGRNPLAFFITVFIAVCIYIPQYLDTDIVDTKKEVLFKNGKNTKQVVVTTYKDYFVVAPYIYDKKRK